MNLQKKLAIAYVLFGVGFAFVIFGFILYITPPKYKDYNEEEIIEKARALGMEFIKESIKIDEEQKNFENDKENSENNNSDEESKEVIFIIEKGESSKSIVKRLFEKGIIKDIDEFDNYLESNKMSTKLQYGKYSLIKSMDYDELINIITVK